MNTVITTSAGDPFCAVHGPGCSGIGCVPWDLPEWGEWWPPVETLRGSILCTCGKPWWGIIPPPECPVHPFAGGGYVPDFDGYDPWPHPQVVPTVPTIVPYELPKIPRTAYGDQYRSDRPTLPAWLKGREER